MGYPDCDNPLSGAPRFCQWKFKKPSSQPVMFLSGLSIDRVALSISHLKGHTLQSIPSWKGHTPQSSPSPEWYIPQSIPSPKGHTPSHSPPQRDTHSSHSPPQRGTHPSPSPPLSGTHSKFCSWGAHPAPPWRNIPHIFLPEGTYHISSSLRSVPSHHLLRSTQQYHRSETTAFVIKIDS